ncbi:MAG TPA: hypothetical protein VGE02_09455 [Gemmatimonadales bacterium]
MRQELLFRGNFAPGSIKNYTLGRGHLNGLLVYSTANSPETRITVKRRVGKNTHLLVPNFRARDLRRISAIEQGYDYTTDNIFAGIGALLVSKAVATQAEVDASFGKPYGTIMPASMFYIPLGSIYNGSDSEIDITVACDKGWTKPETVAFYAISRDRVPDFMLQTDYSLLQEETHRSVDSLFLVGAEHTVPFETLDPSNIPDLTIQVTDDDSSSITDWVGMHAATQLFGMVESHQLTDIMVLYRKRDAIPADVFAKISGADASKVALVVRRIIFDQQQLSTHTLEELKSLVGRVQKLEQVAPDVAKALRHAGEIAKANQLASVAAEVAASNATDGLR